MEPEEGLTAAFRWLLLDRWGQQLPLAGVKAPEGLRPAAVGAPRSRSASLWGEERAAVLLALRSASAGSPLVLQVNSLHVASPVEAVLQLQDCSVFIKIIDSM